MTTFLVLGVIGLALLLVTLVVGDLVEGVVDGLGPDWLSGTAIAAFLASVGFGGALALQAGASPGIAVAAGAGAGAVAGGVAGWLTYALTNEKDSVTPRTSGLVGSEATVVGEVPVGGYGTVALVVAGHPTRLNARSSAVQPVGTRVRVSDVLSSTAVQVEAIDGAPPGPDTDRSTS